SPDIAAGGAPLPLLQNAAVVIDGQIDAVEKDIEDAAATRIGPIGIDHKNRRMM
ncbi:hypothetical protein ACLOJK_030577, partial [Asimina triloba]